MPAAQHGNGGQSTRAATADTHLLGVQSLVANKLYDADGKIVGKLEEIVLDVRTGCVRHVIVALGGFLGLGRQRFAVPWSALKVDVRHRGALVDMAQMRLTAVRIPGKGPGIRHPAAATVSSAGFPKVGRALGTGD